MDYFIEVVLSMLCIVSSESSIVSTTSGPVKGKLNHDHDVDYFSYEGIPYAENPIGPLRFKAPVAKKPWKTVLDATKQGPVCPQIEVRYKRSLMSEDCLVLNIYVPAKKSRQLKPVFALIHGGGYKLLTANPDTIYGPQLYLKRDVIFVSMNFRLGALGFLSLENENAPGNAGLKDIILALKWIKANVERFGGDNAKITIGGNSSGASAAHYLMLTDKTTGLFQQAFLSSGSAVSYRFLQNKPKRNALALANKLGLSIVNHNLLIKNLTEVDAFTLVDSAQNFLQNERSKMRHIFNPFVPSVELESSEAIITKSPIDIIKSGIPQKVPALVGLTSLEGVYLWAINKKNKRLLENLPKLVADCIPPDLDYPKDSESYQHLVKSISEFYFGETSLSNFTVYNFLEFLSDAQYTFNYDYWIRLYKRQNSSNVLFYYMFDFEGELNWAKLMLNATEISGTSHADDLGYQFITNITGHLLNKVDRRTQRMMDVTMTLLTNFMKYSNPMPESCVGIHWPPYDTKGSYLLLTERPSVRKHGPNARRFDFWHTKYQEFDEYVKAGGRVANNNFI